MLQIGSVVDRKYKILSEVGHGGMSVVYLAINERANKTWAIKEVRKDGVCNFEAVKQGLIVETDMLKKLNHPHLPSIIDVIDTDDSFLIVMDYIEGKSLQSVLKNGGAQPPELVVKWGKQICDVLGYLHSRSPAIIYRDMKPSNLMLKPDGNIMLIDFGTAREFKDKTLVEDTVCLGTRGYAAPEQFGGRGQTDARTDIYCTGATLYHLLTGHSPAEPPYEIKPLRYWNPAFAGTGLEKVINKCCQQDPNARYQTCEELMYALEHVADEDDAARKSRKRKWRSFLASVMLCIFGLAGMLTFHLLGNGASRQTYDFYIDQAEKYSDDFLSAADNYKRAMKIDPGNGDAYLGLLDMIEADGELKQNEEQVLMSFSDGVYLDQLKSANSAAFDEVQFRIGRLYFLMHSHSENDYSKAAKYFSGIVDSPYLDEDQRQLANCLYKIGSYYSGLDSGGLYTESEDTYATLWTDLNSLLDVNVIRSVGMNSYRVAIYNQVLYETIQHLSNIKAAGITREQMEETLAKVEAGLDEIALSDTEVKKNLTAKLDEAKQGLKTAKTEVASAYSKEAN